MTERYLVVGLGNPGPEYANTRHNVGFMCADALARTHGLEFARRKQSKARVADGMIAKQRVLVAKPYTYMNLSGTSVQGLASFYQIPPARILIIFDDLDVPFGTLRIRPKGGSSGQKGMKDIITRLGTQNFPRIRFGIGRPPGQMDPAAYVLRRFNADEQRIIEDTVARVLQAIELWLTSGIEQSMNRYNGSVDDVRDRQTKSSTPLPPAPRHNDTAPEAK